MLGRDYQLSSEPQSGSGFPEVILDYENQPVRLPAGPLPVKSMAADVVAVRQLEPGLSVSAIEQVLGSLSVPDDLSVWDLPRMFIWMSGIIPMPQNGWPDN